MHSLHMLLNMFRSGIKVSQSPLLILSKLHSITWLARRFGGDATYIVAQKVHYYKKIAQVLSIVLNTVLGDTFHESSEKMPHTL